MAFSQDGERIFGRSSGVRVKGWVLATGKECPLVRPFPAVYRSTLSPDGRRKAVACGSTVLLVDPAKDCAAWLEFSRSDPRWHAEQADAALRNNHWFAAAFHLDRLLRERPWDADLHVRRAHALARQGRAAEASIQLLHALFFNPQVRLAR